MKTAYQKDAALLADIAEQREEAPDALHIWWLGQSGFLVQADGKCVLFDPYLSDSLTRKYAETDKPHVRMTEQVVAPGALSGIDVITSTHNHTDHLDKETLLPLMEANPEARLVIPEANRRFVCERLGVDEAVPIGLTDGERKEVNGIQILGTPAAHNAIDRDGEGRPHYMGYVAQMGSWSIYHSGDTRPIEGLGETLRADRIDVALLPINGMLEERRVSGNLWGQEAAALAAQMEARCVIPCHYDMFTFNTETPLAFEEACQRRGQPYRILQNGERYTLNP